MAQAQVLEALTMAFFSHSLPQSSRYEVVGTISKTLFGEVKLATDKITGNHVAIKVTNKKTCTALRSSDVGIMDDWQHELSVTKALHEKFDKSGSSPVVHFVDFFEDEIEASLVMEYLPLGDLFNYLCRKHRISELHGKKLFFQIVKAVRKLHIAGYAHLDLSLENIMLGNKGNVKLCDLAVASEIHTSSSRKGQLIVSPKLVSSSLPFRPGKEMYRAPELNVEGISPEDVNGIAADTYSLGVILFCILYGFNPYKSSCKDEDPIYTLIVDDSVHFSCILELLEIKGHVSEAAEDLLSSLVCPVSSRIPLKQVLEHPWFKDVSSNLE
eukprot:TRINITY_DN9273_c0_g1_i1.p1 TRINITY_DN9273_c0_g1~~TRINITY_DN9273_c0_g1_i1.p1  ORF type:complete len:327 (+),score=63.02 TRINITY_DN9273_c0_g1_i1:72-1052(+)